MIKAAIFDMDGVLIDSEPFWQEAEIIAFGRVGVELTREMCMETMGMRVDEVVKYRFDKHGWQGKSLQEVQVDILAELDTLIAEKGEAMSGVEHVLSFFEERKLPFALASSSSMRLIKSVLQKLEITQRFETIHSAEFEEFGKPHPAIYVTTLKQLGLEPHEVIAFEDSFNGLLAAKSARLKTVCIPEANHWHETKYDIADLKLRSLQEFGAMHLQALSIS